MSHAGLSTRKGNVLNTMRVFSSLHLDEDVVTNVTFDVGFVD